MHHRAAGWTNGVLMTHQALSSHGILDNWKRGFQHGASMNGMQLRLRRDAKTLTGLYRSSSVRVDTRVECDVPVFLVHGDSNSIVSSEGSLTVRNSLHVPGEFQVLHPMQLMNGYAMSDAACHRPLSQLAAGVCCV